MLGDDSYLRFFFNSNFWTCLSSLSLGLAWSPLNPTRNCPCTAAFRSFFNLIAFSHAMTLTLYASSGAFKRCAGGCRDWKVQTWGKLHIKTHKLNSMELQIFYCKHLLSNDRQGSDNFNKFLKAQQHVQHVCNAQSKISLLGRGKDGKNFLDWQNPRDFQENQKFKRRYS